MVSRYEVVSTDPFVVRLGGVKHQALPVSAEAVVQFRRATAAATTDQERVRALEQLLTLAFPLTWAILWRGNPVRQLLALPGAELTQFLRDFLSSLVVARRPGTWEGSPSRTRIPNARPSPG